MTGRVRIGISGWRYAPWRGIFYPEDLLQRRELWFASRRFSTIEINGSFYSLQRPEYYERWHRETPRGFIFSVKGHRYITHLRRLHEIEKPLANFFASGLFALGEKLGPLLWQFPPSFHYDPALMEAFFAQLPRDLKEAQRLARGREPWMKGRTCLAIERNRPMRHAVEIRHDSFLQESFPALLRKYGIALVTADTAGKWPQREDVTTDFIYLRLHGDKEIYASGYTRPALRRWARRIAAWRSGGEPRDAQRISPLHPKRRRRDVYCYFDNDIKVKAPYDAETLEKLVRSS
jgi:uncharacterized protein YecE (DUF72 family)